MQTQRYLAILLFFGILVVSIITLNNKATQDEASVYRNQTAATSTSSTPPTSSTTNNSDISPITPPTTNQNQDVYTPPKSNYDQSYNSNQDVYTPPPAPPEPPHNTPPNVVPFNFDRSFVPVLVYTTDLFRNNPSNNFTEVKSLQQFLIAREFLAGASDLGIFGPLTQAAVIRFQLANNITPAAGYVGAKTRAVINSIIEKKIGGGTSTNSCECGTYPHTGHWSTVSNTTTCKVDDCTGSPN